MIDFDVLRLDMDAVPAELPFYPAEPGCDFVYLLRTYSLLEGADIAIWTKSRDGCCTQRVYATGAIIEFHPSIDLASLPFSRDERIPRSERIEKVLEALPRRNWPHSFIESLNRFGSPIVDSQSEISADEIQKLFELANRVNSSGEGILGVDSYARIISRKGGQLTDVNTWGGSGDFQLAWGTINTMLEIARILELPLREFDRETEQFKPFSTAD